MSFQVAHGRGGASAFLPNLRGLGFAFHVKRCARSPAPAGPIRLCEIDARLTSGVRVPAPASGSRLRVSRETLRAFAGSRRIVSNHGTRPDPRDWATPSAPGAGSTESSAQPDDPRMARDDRRLVRLNVFAARRAFHVKRRARVLCPRRSPMISASCPLPRGAVATRIDEHLDLGCPPVVLRVLRNAAASERVSARRRAPRPGGHSSVVAFHVKRERCRVRPHPAKDAPCPTTPGTPDAAASTHAQRGSGFRDPREGSGLRARGLRDRVRRSVGPRAAPRLTRTSAASNRRAMFTTRARRGRVRMTRRLRGRVRSTCRLSDPRRLAAPPPAAERAPD